MATKDTLPSNADIWSGKRIKYAKPPKRVKHTATKRKPVKRGRSK